MRKMRLTTFLIVAILTLSAGMAGAQGQPLTEQDRQAILGYSFTLQKANEIIGAAGEMTKYLASRPDIAEVMARAMKMTRPELIAQMERDPQAMAIATKHGLTAREYNYGVPALRMALLAAQGLTGPSIIASPANVAFAKANLAELKPKMDAVDGVGGRR
jgi:hypothetical protein